MTAEDAWSCVTASPLETERLGAALAALLDNGSVIALYGTLATGKTCLVRGMVSRMGDPVAVHSPTFTLVNEYGTAQKLYHLDLYRLHHQQEIEDLGYAELFDPEGICVVEWAERAEGLLPQERIDIRLEHAGDDRRNITITNKGLLETDWQESLKECLVTERLTRKG